MRTLRRRTARPALALLAVLALGACGGESEPVETAAPAVTVAPTTAPAPVETTAPAPSPTPELQTITLTWAGGEVGGDTGRVAVPLGSTFRLVVTSDVAEEVHVHGYDDKADLAPGVPTELTVLADRPGVFEIELEESGTQLTRIQVS